MKICPKCLKSYKKSKKGISARKKLKNGDTSQKWGKGKWPNWVYNTTSDSRLCLACKISNNYSSSKRRAIKLNACVPWSDLEKIKKIYAESAKITKDTGVKMEVDHVIPLMGKNVTGLHVESNLRIITAKENRKKSNKFTI